MGVAATVALTAAMGIWKAKSEYDQNKAAARQAEANAEIQYLNADKKESQAYEQAQNNALNQEVKRRQLAAKQAQDENSVNASGLTMSGSNVNVLADSQYNMMFDQAIDAYNGRQKVENIFQQSTDFVNQGDQYKEQARQYKKAARNSLIKNAISTGASIAMIYAGGGLSKAGDAAKETGGAAQTWGSQYYMPASVQQNVLNSEMSNLTTGTSFGSSYANSIGKNLKYIRR